MSRLTIAFLVIVAPVLAVCLAVLGLVTIQTNPMGWFLLLVGIVYAAGTVFITVARRQRFWEARAGMEAVQEEHGDRSFWLITLAMMAVFYLSPVEYIFYDAGLPRTVWMKACGFGLVVMGSALFVWARRILGANYSGHVLVGNSQVLVQNGPYRFIRHPAYSGFLFMALGISLGYSSLAGLISVLALLLPGLVYRMTVEEKLLIGHFGEAYRRYASTVEQRLVPGIW